ncbi:MAG: flavodoxin family protein [Candidatus Methanosuratincola sp.]|nr:hypothetical protein [Candidatus Methanosuratincola sp.]
MKVLVVYDSVSTSKVTMKVAQTIAEEMKAKGLETDCLYCKDLGKEKVKGYGSLIVGAPTMAFRPSRDITEFLDSLEAEDVKGKKGAAFDTQIKSALSGNAAKGIEKRISGLGASIFKPHLVAYVEGKGKNSWELREGELENVKKWAQEAAEAILAE